MKNSNEKWVLVTGANGGIGKALVTCFAENGYSVVATDITDLTVSAPNITNLKIDLERIVLDEAYADILQKDVIELTSGAGLTALVNNAAVQILGSVREVSREDWLKSMNVNVYAPFFMVQLFL